MHEVGTREATVDELRCLPCVGMSTPASAVPPVESDMVGFVVSPEQYSDLPSCQNRDSPHSVQNPGRKCDAQKTFP
jgi:hypothetical protein